MLRSLVGSEMCIRDRLKISHTEPGIKGNTATNTFKPAKTETGADIQVPLFINEGDKIKVDTVKGNYKERHKE